MSHHLISWGFLHFFKLEMCQYLLFPNSDLVVGNLTIIPTGKLDEMLKEELILSFTSYFIQT